jgi:hypothetical protein
VTLSFPPWFDFIKKNLPSEKLPVHSFLAKNSPFSFTNSETAEFLQTTVLNFARFVRHLPKMWAICQTLFPSECFFSSCFTEKAARTHMLMKSTQCVIWKR